MSLWSGKCGSALIWRVSVASTITALATKGLYPFVLALRALFIWPILCAALAVGACLIGHVQCEQGDVGFILPSEWVIC